MTEFKCDVESPQEYKEAVEHAQALGFEVSKCFGYGHWDAEGAPAWPKKCEIEKVGRKYFHIPLLDGEEVQTFKCVPREGGDGGLEITFSDE